MPEDLETWPFGLPTNNYTVKPANVCLRSRMDSGAERKRQAFTVDMKRMSVEFELEDHSFGYFEAWFRGIINQGASWFLMDVAMGTAIKNQKVRFVEAYTAKYVPHMQWLVTAELEVQEADLIDPNMLSLLLDEVFVTGLPDFEDSMANYYILVHTTMPNDLN